MRKKEQRFLVILFITLLIISSIAFPLMTARKTEAITKLNLTTSGQGTFSITEFRSDGTIRLSSVTMSEEQVREFVQELHEATSIEEKLSLYKKYNLVDNASVDTLRNEMEQQVKKMDESREQQFSKVGSKIPFFYFFYCSLVSGIGIGYYLPSVLFLTLGTSLLTRWINGQYPWLISVDLVDYVIGELDFQLKGPRQSLGGYFIGMIKMVGFVGFAYQYGGRHGYNAQGFDGFAVYVRAIGRFYYY
jgi:hypothetical protein